VIFSAVWYLDGVDAELFGRREIRAQIIQKHHLIVCYKGVKE
jgi:hypothetical protein